MKERLTQIFNSLKQVETKGDNTIIMGECLKALYTLIDNYEEQAKEAIDE